MILNLNTRHYNIQMSACRNIYRRMYFIHSTVQVQRSRAYPFLISLYFAGLFYSTEVAVGICVYMYYVYHILFIYIKINIIKMWAVPIMAFLRG